jgi:hypothetical protein
VFQIGASYHKNHVVYYFILKRKSRKHRKAKRIPGMVEHICNPSTREAEAGRLRSLRSAWAT